MDCRQNTTVLFFYGDTMKMRRKALFREAIQKKETLVQSEWYGHPELREIGERKSKALPLSAGGFPDRGTYLA